MMLLRRSHQEGGDSLSVPCETTINPASLVEARSIPERSILLCPQVTHLPYPVTIIRPRCQSLAQHLAWRSANQDTPRRHRLADKSPSAIGSSNLLAVLAQC